MKSFMAALCTNRGIEYLLPLVKISTITLYWKPADVLTSAAARPVTSYLDDKPSGRQTSGRQTNREPGRQPTGRHVLVNRATEVETTGPQLWKCERLTIAVLQSNYVQS